LQAVVLEGKYWKRNMVCLVAEYQKWRLFFKEKFATLQKDNLMKKVDASLSA